MKKTYWGKLFLGVTFQNWAVDLYIPLGEKENSKHIALSKGYVFPILQWFLDPTYLTPDYPKVIDIKVSIKQSTSFKVD